MVRRVGPEYSGERRGTSSDASLSEAVRPDHRIAARPEIQRRASCSRTDRIGVQMINASHPTIMRPFCSLLIVCALSLIIAGTQAQTPSRDNQESQSDYAARMKWWSEARFGLFIHWGLYSIPAGEWKGQTGYGEWIRHSAHIPVGEYDKFLEQFNPVKFNADTWVRAAKEAGMKYIVITSKHHDGFCLFDSKFTDFDVMSTPFKRDILRELAEACRKEGMKLCFYHSIMDWHHPDYLPRRPWETTRTSEGADFERFVRYVKNELKELLTNYGDIGVLWFDGNWESTWSNDRGRDLYNYVRSLQPNIITN